MFSRETGVIGSAQLSEEMLPTRGSDHPAFVEMGFVWGDHHEDQRFRHVTMPTGFRLWTIQGGEIHDGNGNLRAKVVMSEQRSVVPSIYPVKRFSIDVETAVGFVGVVRDWGDPVYRTRSIGSQSVAVATARKWLDEHKSGWDSYSSPVNFERRPAKRT